MERSIDPVDVVVVGGGMTGLAAADRLRRAGRSVAVLEAAPTFGGLTKAIHVGGEPVEAYYHHIFPQDRETRDLVDRLGFSEDLEWRRARMGILHGGRVYPFDSPADLLRFSPLPLASRVRVAVGTAVQLIRRDARTLDRTDVVRGTSRWFGRDAYELLWRPLLAAKFGKAAPQVPMAWLVARIRQRAGGRRATGDRLGYLRGSLGRLAEAYGHLLEARGAIVRPGTRATAIVRAAGGWDVVATNAAGESRFRAGAVIAAVSGELLGRIAPLGPAYASAVRAIPYRGVVCVLLEATRSLSPFYWINVTDRLGYGCAGIIEHTNFIPAERYGGRHLVYLAHYVDRDEPAWSAAPEELLAAVEPAFRALNPAYRSDWIVGIHVSRDPFAQPVPQVGGPMPELGIRTGEDGLFHASLAHIYPDDRGVSMALRLGDRVAAAADDHLRAGAR